MGSKQPLDASQILFLVFSGGINQQGVQMLFFIGEACKALGPNKIPSINTIITDLVAKGAYRLPDGQRLTKADLPDVYQLQEMTLRLGMFDKRYETKPEAKK